MAAPTFESFSWGAYGNNTTTFAKPTGTVEGDLLVAFILWDNHDNFGAWWSYPPSGWTELYDQVNFGTEDVTGALYYKFAGASEPTDYTFTSDAAGLWGVMVRVSGADAIDVHSMAANDFGQTYPVGPLTTSGDDRLLLYVFMLERMTASPASLGREPTGFTEAGFRNEDHTNDTCVGLYHAVQAAAGSTGTVELSDTHTNAASVASLVAVAPPGPVDLASTVGSASTVTGDVIETDVLAGGSAGTSIASGALSTVVVPTDLQGDSAGVASASGRATHLDALVGTASATSTAGASTLGRVVLLGQAADVVEDREATTWGNSYCEASAYADAREGQNTSFQFATEAGEFGANVGQRFTTIYSVSQSVWEFDVSDVPAAATFQMAKLSVFSNWDQSDVDFVMEAREHDWATFDFPSVFVPGSSLAGKTLLASRDTALGFAGGSYHDFPQAGSALEATVLAADTLRFVLASSRQRTGSAPTSTEERVQIRTSDGERVLLHLEYTVDEPEVQAVGSVSGDISGGSVQADGTGAVAVSVSGGLLGVRSAASAPPAPAAKVTVRARAAAVLEYPPVEPPHPSPLLRRISRVYPAPTLDSKGRPT